MEMTSSHLGRFRIPLLKWLAAVCGLLLAGSAFAFFNDRGVLSGLPGSRYFIQTAQIDAEAGNNYIARHGMGWLSSNDGPSPAQLLEEGVPLGQANALHDDIRSLGKGRYSFWGDSVYFSSSDNTNPIENGRRYEIYAPLQLPRRMVVGLYGLTALAWSLLCVAGLRGVGRNRPISAWQSVLLPWASELRRLLALARRGVGSVPWEQTGLHSRNIAATWLAVSLALLASSLFIQISILQESPGFWEHHSLQSTDIRAEAGNNYIARHGMGWLSSNDGPSPAQLLEEGVPLGQANALHDDIRSLGKGRYSFWGDSVYFSSSDNTNPIENGRRYEIYAPTNQWNWVVNLTIFSWLGFLAFSIVAERRVWGRLIAPKPLLVFSSVAVTLAYLLPRLPFFVDYPVPVLSNDTTTYFGPVRDIFSGQWPIFAYRTPGYPLFVTLVFSLSPTLMAVVVTQSILTLSSSQFFLWAVFRSYPRLLPCVALAMIAHVAQPMLSAHDFLLLSESLFASCLVLSLGFLFLALRSRRSWLFLACSSLAGYAILTRPAGIFLVALPLLTSAFLVTNGYPKRAVLCMSVPLPMMIVLLMLYNYASAGFCGVSMVGGQTTFALTSAYWEPDPNFPDDVNEGIRRFREEVSTEDARILGESWDPEKLYPPFVRYAGSSLFTSTNSAFYVPPEIGQRLAASPRLASQWMSTRFDLASRIAWKAFSSHPDMYAKWVWTMGYGFFSDQASWHTSLYDQMASAYEQFYVPGVPRDRFFYREYSEFPQLPALRVVRDHDAEHLVILPTFLYKVNMKFNDFLIIVFDSGVWLWLYLAILAAAPVALGRSKFRNAEVFALFAVGSMHLLAGLTMAATTSNVDRYPAPTKFVEYLAVSIGLTLLVPRGKEILCVLLGGYWRRTNEPANPSNLGSEETQCAV